jgi:hypothetical protein
MSKFSNTDRFGMNHSTFSSSLPYLRFRMRSFWTLLWTVAQRSPLEAKVRFLAGHCLTTVSVEVSDLLAPKPVVEGL